MIIFILMSISKYADAQKIIELPYEQPKNVSWNGGEKEYHSELWDTKVVTNVSLPTMMMYEAAKDKATGASVIIAPGGWLFAHSIESEGIWVAEWLAKNGVTAFVLKYRLVPTGEDGVAEISHLSQTNPSKLMAEVQKVIPYSVADGLEAITYVRNNALQYDLDPNKIGFMGFSAGGAVTMGVGYEYKDQSKPNFLVPVYAWVEAMPVREPRDDAPPMLIVCATDDPLGLAKGSIELYNSWHENQISVGLHMYARGGHGFGMRKNGNASDSWIERFYDWAVNEGIIVLNVRS